MPAGVTTTSGNTGTCTGVTVASTTITMASGSTIPPGGCTIVVKHHVVDAGHGHQHTSTLQRAAAAPRRRRSAPLTVTGRRPTLTKTIAPATIRRGWHRNADDHARQHAGATPLTLTAAFTDTMPAGVTTTSANTGTCTGVTVTSTRSRWQRVDDPGRAAARSSSRSRRRRRARSPTRPVRCKPAAGPRRRRVRRSR